MKLFDPEGPLMSALGTFCDLVFCNVLFCLLSLPLFTVGASAAALYDCTLAIVQQNEGSSIVARFWAAFRRNFRRATVLWFVLLGAALFLWAYARAVDALSGDLHRLYRVTFFVLLFVFLAGAQYVFPLQARFRRAGRTVSIPYTLKTAWLLSAAALPWTLCALGISVGAVYVSFFLNSAALNTAVFLWAFGVFAVIAYLQSFLYVRAFRVLDRLAP